jgi:hypothetical protein
MKTVFTLKSFWQKGCQRCGSKIGLPKGFVKLPTVSGFYLFGKKSDFGHIHQFKTVEG